jgi:peptidoglycan hydrolase-like protein with peptidoglycan-binding domain
MECILKWVFLQVRGGGGHSVLPLATFCGFARYRGNHGCGHGPHKDSKHMRTFPLTLILATGFGLSAPLTAPVQAQDLGEVVSGIAESLLAQELDKQAYIAAQEANTVNAYRGYLQQYPRGVYRANAERALARLGAPVEGTVAPPVSAPPPVDGVTPSPQQVEAQLGITRSQRVAVQRELTRLGYSTGGADGVWGRNTRSAIVGWQRGTGYTGTGYLTEMQLRTLLGGGSVVTPVEPEPEVADTPARVEAALGLTRAQRIAIQGQLTKLGHDAGVADGLWGSRTRMAISGWQRANRQTETGYVTAAQVRLLAEQAGPVAGPAEPTEDAALEERLLGLSLAERVDLQRRLTRLGYSTYGADGVFGRNTRTAISGWQRDEALAVTGYLTADQVRLIRVQTGG